MTERERLMLVMERESLSAKQFAMEVGIQPGTISNIMSGRNNPSLDVMQRVLQRFRSLNSDWLILGVGQMYRQDGEMPRSAPFDIRPESMDPRLQDGMASLIHENDGKTGIIHENERISTDNHGGDKADTGIKKQPTTEQKVVVNNREIQKIMIFYTDGTFEER